VTERFSRLGSRVWVLEDAGLKLRGFAYREVSALHHPLSEYGTDRHTLALDFRLKSLTPFKVFPRHRSGERECAASGTRNP